jgi:hypothetical protein
MKSFVLQAMHDKSANYVEVSNVRGVGCEKRATGTVRMTGKYDEVRAAFAANWVDDPNGYWRRIRQELLDLFPRLADPPPYLVSLMEDPLFELDYHPLFDTRDYSGPTYEPEPKPLPDIRAFLSDDPLFDFRRPFLRVIEGGKGKPVLNPAPPIPSDDGNGDGGAFDFYKDERPPEERDGKPHYEPWTP